MSQLPARRIVMAGCGMLGYALAISMRHTYASSLSFACSLVNIANACVPAFFPFFRPPHVPTVVVLLGPSGHPAVTVPVSNTWPLTPLWVCSLLPGKDPVFYTTVLSFPPTRVLVLLQ